MIYSKPTVEYQNLVDKGAIFPGGFGSARLIADPFIGGWGFLFFTRIPKAVIKLTSAEGKDDDMSFFKLLQTSFKELTGIGDMTLGETSITAGFAGNEFIYPTVSKKETTAITLKFQELQSGVYNKPFTNWVSAISDPITGLRQIPSDRKDKLSTIRDYTVEFIYIACGPSVGSADDDTRAASLEKAFYFTQAFPTKMFLQHFEYNDGSHEGKEIDQEFKVNMNIGSAIDEFGKKILGSKDFYEQYIQKQHEFLTDNIGKEFTGVDSWIKTLGESGSFKADSEMSTGGNRKRNVLDDKDITPDSIKDLVIPKKNNN